jgi:hypothetical protein
MLLDLLPTETISHMGRYGTCTCPKSCRSTLLACTQTGYLVRSPESTALLSSIRITHEAMLYNPVSAAA